MTTTHPDPAGTHGVPAPDASSLRREAARLAALPRVGEPTTAEVLTAEARAAARAGTTGRTVAATPPGATPPGAGRPRPTLADLDSTLTEIASVEEQVAILHARRAELVARACRLAAELEADLVDATDPVARVAPSSRRLELARRAVVADLATSLHVGEHAAASLADHAETLTTRAPRTFSALKDGELTWAHAVQVAKHVADLDPSEAAAVDTAVIDCAAGCTPAQLGARARRFRELLHPVPLDVRHSDAATRRAVWLDDGRDGMAWLTAHLPAPLAHAAYDRLTRTAGHVGSATGPAEQHPADVRSPDQLRADVLAALLLDDGSLDDCSRDAPDGAAREDDAGRPSDGRPEDPLLELLCRQRYLVTLARSVRPRVNVTVPVMTLLGRSDAPGTLDGEVPIDAETTRRLAALAPSFRRILTHPESGAVLSVGRDSYAVPADLRAVLEQRDVTCRFPGCRRPAHRTDADHTTAWADGGPTAASNLALLCRRHHVTKHQTSWAVRQLPGTGSIGSTSSTGSARAESTTDGGRGHGGPAGVGGVLEWTSPTGRTHRTHPGHPATTVHRALPRCDVPDDDLDAPEPDGGVPPADDDRPPPF